MSTFIEFINFKNEHGHVLEDETDFKGCIAIVAHVGLKDIFRLIYVCNMTNNIDSKIAIPANECLIS